MKALKTIISIVFIVGTIAIIIYDSRTRSQKTKKATSAKTDSVSHAAVKK